MREIEIPVPASVDDRTIDRAIAGSGLTVAMRSTLRKFPGCVHWHLKHGREAGTLEITYWPRERRAWFTIQSGRDAAWIEGHLELLDAAIRRGLRPSKSESK